MFGTVSINKELKQLRSRSLKHPDMVMNEVNKILQADLFKEGNILNNLKSYNKSFELLNEEGLDQALIFRTRDIKEIAVKYRLRFIDSQNFSGDVPYEAILKIKDLNKLQGKDLHGFKLMAPAGLFKHPHKKGELLLFAPTVYGNYYLVHHWGKGLNWFKRLSTIPMRRFETLFPCLILLALTTALSVPTRHITLDRHVTYWCGYRVAAFFHLLIFYSGFTVFALFGFNQQFSQSIWDSDKGLK